jgi:GNAT superfamily N-acetyltransferase/catechol 2,3-dioxygenase-like lactoylglutathione lyase family enzyme
MIEGLSHVTVLARDLDAMERFLIAAFEAVKVYDSGQRTFSLSEERFFLIGEGPAPVWLAVMRGDPPARTYQHVAFRIDPSGFDAAQARIDAAGIEQRPGRPRVEGEARSIYVYSPEGHLFELHDGTLADRLARYCGPDRAEPTPASIQPAIRPATPADLPALAGMIAALAAVHGDDSRTSAQSLLVDVFGAHPWAHILIAQDAGGQPIGYAALVPAYQAQFARRSVDLHHLYVEPTGRAQGVGRALVAACVEWARARGAERLTVGAHPSNKQAQRYYRALGFADLPSGGMRFVMDLG